MKHSAQVVFLWSAAIVFGLLSFTPARGLHNDDEKARQISPVTIKVNRGVKVIVDNRTSGRITVKGWDRDVIEAHAQSSRGQEVVIVKKGDEGAGQKILVKADYANTDHPEDPTLYLDDPPEIDGNNLKVNLEVNVPRYAELGLIEVWRSDVEVSGLETLVAVSGDRSSVILKDVEAAEVRTKSGNVEIDGVKGLVSVATSSGAIHVRDSRGLVRANSIAGPIEIKCSSGRVDVSTTEAPIDLINVDGDVDAVSTNSGVRFTGKLRDDGRYYLKSMFGRVEVLLPPNPSGFNATLSSYRGIVESDFNLTTKQSPSDAAHNRRRVGTYGDGKAQLTLDSFEGLVRLTKLAAVPKCN